MGENFNQFIALNDGSTINNIQCVVDFENTPDETLKELLLALLFQTGTLVESKGAGQKFEIQVKTEILEIQMQRSSQYKQRTKFRLLAKMRI
jgi:aspartyl/asparaginyl-tRNA synthetase